LIWANNPTIITEMNTSMHASLLLALSTPGAQAAIGLVRSIVTEDPAAATAWAEGLVRAERASFFTDAHPLGLSLSGGLTVWSDMAVLSILGVDTSVTAFELTLLPTPNSLSRLLLAGELRPYFVPTPVTSDPRGRPEDSEVDVPEVVVVGNQLRFMYFGNFDILPSDWDSFSHSITSDRLQLSFTGNTGTAQNVSFSAPPVPEPSTMGLFLLTVGIAGIR
jgi:hypothetical protein